MLITFEEKKNWVCKESAAAECIFISVSFHVNAIVAAERLLCTRFLGQIDCRHWMSTSGRNISHCTCISTAECWGNKHSNEIHTAAARSSRSSLTHYASNLLPNVLAALKDFYSKHFEEPNTGPLPFLSRNATITAPHDNHARLFIISVEWQFSTWSFRKSPACLPVPADVTSNACSFPHLSTYMNAIIEHFQWLTAGLSYRHLRFSSAIFEATYWICIKPQVSSSPIKSSIFHWIASSRHCSNINAARYRAIKDLDQILTTQRAFPPLEIRREFSSKTQSANIHPQALKIGPSFAFRFSIWICTAHLSIHFHCWFGKSSP